LCKDVIGKVLKIHNWGVFRGRHSFDLEHVPQSGEGDRHLTVFSGHNGAGKSTLFQAIALALHGSLALGDRVSRQAYSDFLLSRLHRRSADGTPLVSNQGGVELGFLYMQSGQPFEILVKRYWRRTSRNVLETLTVLQDGEPSDVDPADYQIWLNDLVPPGLASLSFFDAERLDALANPEQHNGLLGKTLHRLLGLDLVERLQADLDYYTRRGGGGGRVSRLREEVLQRQAVVDDLIAQLDQLQSEAEALLAQQSDLEAELASQERRLAAAGGNYAARRPMLQERLGDVEGEIEDIADQLRKLSAGLLPFALAPELCQSLSQRLVQEVDVRRRRAANQSWQERVDHLEAAIRGDELWHSLETSPLARQTLSQRLVRMLHEQAPSDGTGEQLSLHHLAESEEEQLQSWITQALQALPQQVQTLGQRMRALRSERQRVEEDLNRAPDDEVLAPIHAEIMRLQDALTGLQRQQKDLDKRIGALQFRRDERARELQHAAERLAAAQGGEQQLALAEQSKLVLRTYQDALTRQRLGMLEERLVAAFNTICRKEHLLKDACINPTVVTSGLHSISQEVVLPKGETRGESTLVLLDGAPAGEKELAYDA